MRSDVDTVYVDTGYRGLVAIPREDIRRVSHPGAAAIGVGTVGLAAGGTLAIASALTPDPCADGGFMCFDLRWLGVFVGASLATASLGTVLWGAVVHRASKMRMEPPTETELSIAPAVLFEGGRAYVAGTVGWRW